MSAPLNKELREKYNVCPSYTSLKMPENRHYPITSLNTTSTNLSLPLPGPLNPHPQGR